MTSRPAMAASATKTSVLWVIQIQYHRNWPTGKGKFKNIFLTDFAPAEGLSGHSNDGYALGAVRSWSVG